MSFDPNAAEFKWPTSQTLTRALDNAQLSITPSAVNFAGISRGGRQAECFRYYSTPHGLFTELEIGSWYAGGERECMNLLSAYGTVFGDATELPFAQVVVALRQQGFADQTILVNLTWLVEDGYAALETRGTSLVIRKIRSL